MTTGSTAERGFTLIEMAATVAIAGILMTVAVPSLGGWLGQQRLKGAADELASALQFARSEAVMRNQPVRVTFQERDGAACYIVHTGAADSCQCDGTGAARCDSGEPPLKTVALATATGIALQSNVHSVLFAPEFGSASPAASLRLTGAQGRTLQHTVNVMGRVRSCALSGAVSGYRSC